MKRFINKWINKFFENDANPIALLLLLIIFALLVTLKILTKIF